MESPRIQWSGAEVRDGTLTVEIDGDRPKGWKATFEQTVRLLGGGAWGEVKLKSSTVSVSDVSEGSEEQLRHFLESVVLQANATHVEPEGDDEDERDDDGGEAADSEGDDTDARMTGRFRDSDAD